MLPWNNWGNVKLTSSVFLAAMVAMALQGMKYFMNLRRSSSRCFEVATPSIHSIPPQRNVKLIRSKSLKTIPPPLPFDSNDRTAGLQCNRRTALYLGLLPSTRHSFSAVRTFVSTIRNSQASFCHSLVSWEIAQIRVGGRQHSPNAGWEWVGCESFLEKEDWPSEPMGQQQQQQTVKLYFSGTYSAGENMVSWAHLGSNLWIMSRIWFSAQESDVRGRNYSSRASPPVLW